MAVEGIVLEKARQEKGLMALKYRQQSPPVESPKPPSSFETPRASSVSTPRSSVPSSVRSTPARERPGKYVSKMAKAREEKKRREAAVNSQSDKSATFSDMETSSNPSTESGTMSEKSQAQEDKLGNLPKFGEWDKHSANSGPCYTLLFQNAAQEKKIGGPIRVHASQPASEASVRSEDLYGHTQRAASAKKARNKTSYGLLCCFTAHESS